SSLSRGYLDNFVCKANEVVFFKLVRNANDLEEDISANTFHPEYSHQIFGDTESIFGYRDLKIRLFYSSSRLVRYVNIEYTEKISPEKSDGVQPDDILAILNEKLEGCFDRN
ncbi:histone acetyltransferase type B catalytic subunit-like protein, partial [Leptotrombidium deliense]